MGRTVPARLAAWLRVEFGSGAWMPSLTTGLLIGLVEVFFALSVASLLFAGDLAPYLSYGLGIALATQIIVLTVISLGSSVPGVTGSLQDTSGVILAAMAAALFGSLGTASAEERLATVLVGIAVATLLAGAFLWMLGAFRLGRLVRYIPYPVIGGFLAGSGWLLVGGSFAVMTGLPLTVSGLQAALQPGQLALWLPGLLLALALLVALRRVRHFLTMPAILVGAFVLFYLVLLIVGLSVDEAAARGLLLATPSSGPAGAGAVQVAWQPLTPALLAAANLSAILGQWGNVLIVLVLTVVSLLLNASGTELAIHRDIDLNRELRVAGAANLLSGLGGGAVGFHALSLSTLGPRIGSRGRLPSLVAALLLAAVVLGGAPLLALAPRPVVGGLLLFLGLDFLVEWVFTGWSRLSKVDYAIVLLILAVIATTNFLMGVGAGLAAMLLLFVVSYSRISVVHHTLSGAEMRSNVQRNLSCRRRLQELGPQIHILELRGFIFFGTADRLLEQVRSRIAAPALPQVRFVVLDFRRVTGLDSSAIFSFRRCRQLAEARQITLVLTHLTAGMRRQFEVGGLLASEPALRFFPNLDLGLEWCEETLLEHAGASLKDAPLTLPAQLAQGGLDAAGSARLIGYLEQIEVGDGEHLVRQGAAEGDLYLIERGKVSIYREFQDGSRLRLRTLGPGTAIGELGLYLRAGRTASVITDAPTIAHRLTPAALARMRDEEPALAAAFHELMARMIAERLVTMDHAIDALLR